VSHGHSVIRALLARLPRLGPVRLVAIDGPSGSGKSVFADTLVTDLGATLIRTDDFATWDDPVSWWPRLVDGVLEPLSAGRLGRYRRTEWTDGHPHPGDHVEVPVPETLVIEGVSAGRRSIRPRLSFLLWCELADSGERLDRAVARDGPAAQKHLLAWQSFERGWFAVDGTRDSADHLI